MMLELLISFLTLTANGGDEYCPLRLSDGTVVKKYRTLSASLSEEHRTMLGITVGKSNLSTVKEQVGPSPLIQRGDASNFTAKVCYVGPGGMVLSFEAGEMSGPDRTVQSMHLKEGASAIEQKQCTLLKSLSNTLGTEGGIHQGMSLSEFQKIMGNPSRVTKSTILYYFQVEEKRADQTWSRSSTVYGRFKKGKLSDLEISHLKSN